MPRNFTKITAALVAAFTISAAAVSITTDTASAGGWGGERGMGRMGHNHGHMHRGHGFGRGAALGFGAAAILTTAIIAANEHRETVARIRYDQAVRKAPKKKPTRECELVAQWEKLLKSAEATLETDKRMNAQYGNDVRDGKGNVVRTNHDNAHTQFQEQEVERLREELRKAKEACDRQAAR